MISNIFSEQERLILLEYASNEEIAICCRKYNNILLRLKPGGFRIKNLCVDQKKSLIAKAADNNAESRNHFKELLDSIRKRLLLSYENNKKKTEEIDVAVILTMLDCGSAGLFSMEKAWELTTGLLDLSQLDFEAAKLKTCQCFKNLSSEFHRDATLVATLKNEIEGLKTENNDLTLTLTGVKKEGQQEKEKLTEEIEQQKQKIHKLEKSLDAQKKEGQNNHEAVSLLNELKAIFPQAGTSSELLGLVEESLKKIEAKNEEIKFLHEERVKEIEKNEQNAPLIDWATKIRKEIQKDKIELEYAGEAHSHISVCIYDEGKNKHRRLADIINGEVVQFRAKDNEQRSYDNRIFLPESRDLANGNISVWKWRWTLDSNDSTRDRVQSQYLKNIKLIRAKEATFATSIRGLFQHLKETGIPRPLYSPTIYIINPIERIQTGYLVKPEYFESREGAWKLKPTIYYFLKFSLTSTEIISLNHQQFFRFVELRQPDQVENTQDIHEAFLEFLVARLRQNLTEKNFPLTLGELTKFKELFQHQKTHGIIEDFSQLYGCKASETNEVFEKFLKDGKLELLTQFFDEKVLTRLACSSKELRDKCKLQLSEEWRLENSKEIEEEEERKKTKEKELNEISSQIINCQNSQREIEEELSQLRKEVSKLEAKKVEEENILHNLNSEIEQKFKNIQSNVASFIAETSVLKQFVAIPYVNEDINITESKKQSEAGLKSVYSVPFEVDKGNTETGNADSCSALFKAINKNLIRLGFHRNLLVSLILPLLFSKLFRIPIICNGQGEQLAKIISALNLESSFYYINAEDNTAIDRLLSLPSSNKTALVKNAFENFSSVAFREYRDLLVNRKIANPLIFDAEGMSLQDLPSEVWNCCLLLDSDGCTERIKSSPISLQGWDFSKFEKKCLKKDELFDSFESFCSNSSLLLLSRIKNFFSVAGWEGWYANEEDWDTAVEKFLFMQIFGQYCSKGHLEESKEDCEALFDLLDLSREHNYLCKRFL